MQQLGPGGEFDRIRSFAAELGPVASAWGDDCALVTVGDRIMAVSVDTSVDGVHFRREWLTPFEIGWRASAAAVSDLAAEGARFGGVLVSLSVPPEEPADLGREIMAGVGALVAHCGGKVLGGDLTRTATLSLAITALGEVERPVTRSGAAPGDGLWLTGYLGGARAALLAWELGHSPTEGARMRFARPEPRLEQGRWLARHGATAMIDLSDGLGGDAGHLAAASGAALTIDLSLVPVDPAVADGDQSQRRAVAVHGGEDYELLVTLPATFGEHQAAALEADTGVRLTRVGAVSPGEGVALMLEGRRHTIKGFDHFS